MGTLNRIAYMVAMVVMVGGMSLWHSEAKAGAMTGGACATCHVMHASQNGTATTPYGFLLTSSCLGCHTGVDNVAGTATPFVLTTNAAKPLAGGDFKYITSLGDSYGHNTIELANAEDTAAKATPPGWKNGFAANGQVGDNTAGGGWDNTKLSCEGVYGCHGLHTSTGVQGAHHKNSNSSTDGEALGTVGDPSKGYRFLNGIKGWEDDVYEYNVSNTPASGAHNIYYSEARAADTAVNTQTISYSCAECHGIFHSGAGTEGVGNASFASPWIRHPVDMVMPSSAGTDYEHYTAYRVDTPVGSSSVANNALTVANAADRIVMCLSCHVAHASPYPSALRWDPTTDVSNSGGAGNTSGCMACHSYKDGVTTN